MSATLSIYKIAKDVKWLPGPYYNRRPPKITDTLIEESVRIHDEVVLDADKKFGSDADNPEKDKWILEEYEKRDPAYIGKWSDNKGHDTFNFFKCNRKNIGSRNKRVGKYLELARKYFGEYIQCEYGKYKCNGNKYLVLDQIFYRQGWFFTKKLFNCKNSIFYAFDKTSAKRLVKNLIDTSKKGREAYDSVIKAINTFKDDEHFILEIAF